MYQFRNFNVSDDDSPLFVIMLHCCIQCENSRQDIIAGLSNFQLRVTTSQSYYNALAKRFTVGDSIERIVRIKTDMRIEELN